MAGKSHQDRELASEVRSMVLEEIKAVLEYKPSDTDDGELVLHMIALKEQLILKMSTSILPRLNELSGPDGGEIPLPIYGGKSKEE